MTPDLTTIATLRPDLNVGERLRAHATWAMAAAKDYEANTELDAEQYIKNWQRPVHPLAAMFEQAIANGHRVAVITDGSVTRYNMDEPQEKAA